MSEEKKPTDTNRDDAERIEPDTVPGPIEDGDSAVTAPDQDDEADDGGA